MPATTPEQGKEEGGRVSGLGAWFKAGKVPSRRRKSLFVYEDSFVIQEIYPEMLSLPLGMLVTGCMLGGFGSS